MTKPIAALRRAGLLEESKVCVVCGDAFPRPRRASAAQWKRRQICTAECVRVRLPVARVIAGEQVKHSSGYIKVYVPMHPSSDGTYVYLHRLIAERMAGRLLRHDELVHHINEDTQDNRPENLEIVSAKRHRQIHAGMLDEQIAALILSGHTGKAIVAMGVGSHRVVRVRRELHESGQIP